MKNWHFHFSFEFHIYWKLCTEYSLACCIIFFIRRKTKFLFKFWQQIKQLTIQNPITGLEAGLWISAFDSSIIVLSLGELEPPRATMWDQDIGWNLEASLVMISEAYALSSHKNKNQECKKFLQEDAKFILTILKHHVNCSVRWNLESWCEEY